MSTQQNNAEAADGHSFADKIGQLVSAKYQALFGTTTYSKRRVMSGVVMTRYTQSGLIRNGPIRIPSEILGFFKKSLVKL